MTRRHAVKLLAGSTALLAAGRLRGAEATAPAPAGPSLPIAPGTFTGTRDSLSAYQIPEWFRDAKLGIWAHWGPQSAPEFGDWYARNIYIDKTDQYRHHVATYGHPSKFGYKDIIPLWTGANFDADHLVGLYKAAGAKYFVSMGVHCDNFDLWDSKHTRWNAVKMGPKKNIVGSFATAAKKHGLRFGVSDHLWPTTKWMSVCRGADTKGDLKDVPYDGGAPENRDLYGDYPFPDRKLDWNEEGITDAAKQHYFERIKDLIDQHPADFIYCDGQIPFGDRGLALLAHFYNRNKLNNGGKLEAVYTAKRKEDMERGECVLDFERAVPDQIWPQPFQICSCVGSWHYDRRHLNGGTDGKGAYKTPKRVIDLLVDAVSRNGNLLLNFPLRNDGTLDTEEQAILAEITAWMKVNGDALYATRPWTMFGDGPHAKVKSDPKVKYNESLRVDFTAEDVRFTAKKGELFAFVMGVPEREAVIAPLAPSRGHLKGKIERVTLVGHDTPLKWTLDDTAGLKIELPEAKPAKHALAFRLQGSGLA